MSTKSRATPTAYSDASIQRVTAGHPKVIAAVGAPEPNPQGYLDVLFAPTDTSRAAGQQAAGRIFGRTSDRDEPTTWQRRRRH